MSSIFSQELAALALASKEPGCEPSHSARSTRKQGLFLPSIGPTPFATKTSKRESSAKAKQTSSGGGFPCQDVSNANAVWGERAGLAGERSGLWKHLLRAIRVVRPDYAIVENVAALLGNGMGQVLGDLAEVGYDAEWHCVCASEIGLPHDRDRVWLVAYPIGSRGPRLVTSADFSKAGSWRVRGAEDLQSVANAPFERTDRWPEPLVRRVDDGIPGRLDRLHCIGNAVVPQIPEIIGRAIMDEVRRKAERAGK